ncbi:MAG: phosphatidylglycerophosphatase A [Candidatus Malihini olakiniferum]
MTTSDNKRAAKLLLRIGNPYHFLATGFGSGFSPWMPGTVGSAAAIPAWYLLSFLPYHLYFMSIILSTFIGVYLCHQTTKDIGLYDHSSIVWDEFVGTWITLITIQDKRWQCVLAGFLIFRFLDIFKPWPIRWLDTNVHGGIGIMIDDILAGVISANIIYWIWHHRPLFS